MAEGRVKLEAGQVWQDKRNPIRSMKILKVTRWTVEYADIYRHPGDIRTLWSVTNKIQWEYEAEKGVIYLDNTGGA